MHILCKHTIIILGGYLRIYVYTAIATMGIVMCVCIHQVQHCMELYLELEF